MYDFRALLVPPKEFRDVHTRVPAAQAAVCLTGSARADALQPACCRCLRPGSWSEPAHRSQSPAHRCRLRTGGAFPRARGDAARHRRRRRPELARRRAVLVPQPGGGRLRVHPGDAGHPHAQGRVRSRPDGGDALGGDEGRVYRSHAAVPVDRAVARWRQRVVRREPAALDVRRPGNEVRRRRGCRTASRRNGGPRRRGAWRRRSRRCDGSDGAVARRQAGRLHPRLEPVGARRRHGPRAAADDGRRQVLRLRHGQRRLGQQRPRRSSCGRPTRRRSPPTSRTSARSAKCISSTRRSTP